MFSVICMIIICKAFFILTDPTVFFLNVCLATYLYIRPLALNNNAGWIELHGIVFLSVLIHRVANLCDGNYRLNIYSLANTKLNAGVVCKHIAQASVQLYCIQVFM